jgi:hypothetical protein
MSTARDLGHYPAEPGMLRNTGRHRVGEELMTSDQADTGFIA